MGKLQEITRKKGDSAFFVVIPLPYIKGFNWKKGDNIEFKIMGSDKLKMERKKSPPSKTGGDL